MSKVLKVSRRHFLAGASGFTLAIPFLSSLAPGKAQPAVQKRMVMIGSDHGGVWPEHFYPSMPADGQERELYGAFPEAPQHRVRAGALRPIQDGGDTVLSDTLRASSSVLTDSLVAKMNVLAGFSITTYLGHSRGMIFGNYGSNDQNQTLHDRQMATIDQIIAKHPSFNLAPVRQRSINFAVRYGSSSGIRHAASADVEAGVATAVQADTNPRVIWEKLFEGGGGDAQSVERPELVVDRVYEHYQGLTSGAFGDASRISVEDRRRLDNHMERLLELERRLSVRVDCGAVPQPGDADDPERVSQTVDLIVAAFACGATNMAAISIAGSRMSTDQGWTNWHEQIAHNGGGGRDKPEFNIEFQRINYRAQREVFRKAFLEVASKLDVEEEGGETFLDRSLVWWGMESGATTHSNKSMPIVTAGGAGGAVTMGQFIDLRNWENDIFAKDASPSTFPGVLYNQWLSNAMQAMGLTPEDWAEELRRVQPDEYAAGSRGYGYRQYHESNLWARGNLRENVWPEQYYRDADEPLPFFLNR
ncbi:MAG: DUF1552 domain-containing protein [Myxococcota bacterium]